MPLADIAEIEDDNNKKQSSKLKDCRVKMPKAPYSKRYEKALINGTA